MKKFKYTAVNLQKKKFNGTFLAEDENELRRALAAQNLYLISCKAVTNGSPNAFFTVSGKVSLKELTSFSRQFAIMINSGISILECLNILKEQKYTPYFKKIICTVYDDVKIGVLLSDALKKNKRVFPDFFQSMIYVGEISGKLDVVLNNLADYYEKDAAIKRKTKSAMAYPIVLLVMLIGIIAIMMLFVVPTFKKSLSSLDVKTPLITQIIYDMSEFLTNNGVYLLLGLTVFVVIILVARKTVKGRAFFDYLKVKMPLIGEVQVNLVTARFARGFGLLLGSGLDIIDAMEVIANVLGNKYIEKQFKMAINDVRGGMTMTMAFETYHIFPQVLIQMLAIGEKSGTVDDVLSRSCSFFDEQVESALSAMSAILQPVMLVLMGGTIAVMFIAIYSPMLGIMTGLGT